MCKKNKFSQIFIILLVSNVPFYGQEVINNSDISSITIEQCYQWTKEQYPLIKNIEIIEKTLEYNISNASKGNLPQVNLNGHASYQSAVTEFPVKIPNMVIPSISKDQYKLFGEVYQPLTNYSNINAKKKIIYNNAEISKQKIEIELYQLKDRINQIYIGVLLISEKMEQLRIIKSDLDSTLVKIEAAINYGTATSTDKTILNVERISLDQQIEENKNNQLAYLKMLSLLTGREITEKTLFVKPSASLRSQNINRPELQLFKLQNNSVSLEQKQIRKNLQPKIGLFGQGGFGRPALNFLSNEFEPYYMGGIRFNWNLSSLYNFKNSNKLLDLVSKDIAVQQETFLLNIELTQSQQFIELTKYEQLIKSDSEIITMREDILMSSEVQLKNGLITTIDYVKVLNDVLKARQMLLLHKTQLLLAQLNLETTTGN